ncbi:MAG: hypothetical protein ACFWT1_08725 [Selenomonas sp.]|jgi:methyl-accepting chemotaxis protein
MLDQANYRMSKMYNQKLKSMQSVDEMKYLMRDMQTHELNLADSADAEAQQKNVKTIEDINSRFHNLMDGYTENAKGLEGVPERIEAAKQGLGRPLPDRQADRVARQGGKERRGTRALLQGGAGK